MERNIEESCEALADLRSLVMLGEEWVRRGLVRYEFGEV